MYGPGAISELGKRDCLMGHRVGRRARGTCCLGRGGVCDHLIPDLDIVTKFGKWLPSLVTGFRHAVFGSAAEPLGPTPPRPTNPGVTEELPDAWRLRGRS